MGRNRRWAKVFALSMAEVTGANWNRYLKHHHVAQKTMPQSSAMADAMTKAGFVAQEKVSELTSCVKADQADQVELCKLLLERYCVLDAVRKMTHDVSRKENQELFELAEIIRKLAEEVPGDSN